MNPSTTSFYVTGGTLRHDTPSYVERKADNDLYAGLQAGEFCYVLTSRQMGKSSLMVRTAARLREEGVQVAVLDLTAIGQNLSPEQWYDGLLGRLARQLDLEEELEEFWEEHERFGPLQRWMAALQDVVLRHCPGQIVIFVDEIDAVRSLSFSADEFFAGIRECYTRRAQDPQFGRLTFCLLGVATPSDLIRDTRTTPFNIGRRIDLTDFTAEEAAGLAKGLGRDDRTGKALIERILYWTGGHPYLTQQLCQTVAEDRKVNRSAGVDRHCSALFLSAAAREKDDNLIFVRERLLHNEVDRAALLDLYRQVRAGKSVRPDDTNSLLDMLRLSGVVRLVSNRLVVRNRIYERVFDRAWVTEHMPDAELRRQRAAYLRGLTRAAAVSGLILAVIGALAFSAVRSESRARTLAEERRKELYAAHMIVAGQSWQAEGGADRTRKLLEAQQPGPGQRDLRGFEWRYLWRLCNSDLATLGRFPEAVLSVAFSPDGKLLAVACGDGGHKDGPPPGVTLWDVATKRLVATLVGHQLLGRAVGVMRFSPDGRILATGSPDGSMTLWDVGARRKVATLVGDKRGRLSHLAFSPDGKMLAGGCGDGSVKLWDIAARQEMATLPAAGAREAGGGDPAVAFSADGRTLVTAHQTVQFWDAATRRRLAVFDTNGAPKGRMEFSPDGKVLASVSPNDPVRLWDVATKRELAPLEGRMIKHGSYVGAVAFSPNGKTLAVARFDSEITLWDLTRRQQPAVLKGHARELECVAFSPDGKMLASGGTDRIVKLWSAAPKPDVETLDDGGGESRVAFSPDGRTLAASSGDGTVALRNLITGQVRWIPGPPKGPGRAASQTYWGVPMAFSRDGRMLAAGSGKETVDLWDLASGRRTGTLQGHTRPVRSVAFSPDGKSIAAGAADDTAMVWDVATGRRLASLQADVAAPGSPPLPTSQGVAYSPDGRTLAMGHLDGTTTLWDLATKRVLATFHGHEAWVLCVAFSPDGKTLATGSYDATVRLWDIATRQPAGILQHTGPVASAAFSPDGATLAACRWGGIVTLWNMAMRQEVASFKSEAAWAMSIAFSPDGNLLALGSGDGIVRLWRAPTFAAIEAREAASRAQSSR